MGRVFIAEVMPGISNVMQDVENRLASSYVEEHYNQLVLAAKKMGVETSSCNDIVHDVYMSLRKAEDNGNGFDVNASEEECSTVEQFVYGRLKGYSKNKKYRNDVVKDEVSASSSATDDLESLTSAQRAYELAESYDDLESVEAELSIPEEMQYLLSFETEIGINIRFLLKNINKLATMDFDVSLFGSLRELIIDNEDFSEALKSVLEYAGKFKAKYEVLAASL